MSYTFANNLTGVAPGWRAAWNLRVLFLAVSGVIQTQSGCGTGRSGTVTLDATGDNGIRNTRSWIVLQLPNGWQYCFQFITTDGQQWRIKFSPSAGFVLGSPANNVTPSASDEFVICGGGTDASPTGLQAWGTTTTNYVNCAVNDEAPYAFHAYGWSSNASALDGVVMAEPMKIGSYPVEDTTPPLVWYVDDNSGLASVTGGFASLEPLTYRGAGSTIAVSGLIYRDSTAAHFPIASSTHPANSKYPLLRALFSRKLSDGNQIVKGFSNGVWAPISAHGNGIRYQTDNEVFIKYGIWLMPWPVGVTPLGPASPDIHDAYRVDAGSGLIMPGELVSKSQFQASEALQVRFGAFVNKNTGVIIETGDTVTINATKPNGSAFSGNPISATRDSTSKIWKADIATGSFEAGEWLFRAVSDDTNTLPQYRSYHWGDYVEDVTITKRIVKNRYKIDTTTNTFIIYADDGTTPLYEFDLKDEAGAANARRIFERVPA